MMKRTNHLYQTICLNDFKMYIITHTFNYILYLHNTFYIIIDKYILKKYDY